MLRVHETRVTRPRFFIQIFLIGRFSKIDELLFWLSCYYYQRPSIFAWTKRTKSIPVHIVDVPIQLNVAQLPLNNKRSKINTHNNNNNNNNTARCMNEWQTSDRKKTNWNCFVQRVYRDQFNDKLKQITFDQSSNSCFFFFSYYFFLVDFVAVPRCFVRSLFLVFVWSFIFI